MRRTLLFVLVPVLLCGILAATTATAQLKNVTFVVNVCTAPDTLVPTSVVQLRGSKAPLTWDNLTGGVMTNLGGDYWIATLQFNAGDTVQFKININNSAWEQNVTDVNGLGGGNRSLIVGANDTTLPVQYFNNGAFNAPQYFVPWTAAADSFMNVYFRVDMQGATETGLYSFDKNTDTVAVRGGMHNAAGPAYSDLQWGTSFYLTREVNASNGGFSYDPTNLWSGRLRIAKSQINVGDQVDYKFLIGYTWGRDEYQGGHPNRGFIVPTDKKDTTLQYVWFNDQRPIIRVNQDTVLVTFSANLATAISNGGFSIGDTIVVRSGYFGTAVEMGREKKLARQGLSTRYAVTDTIITTIGSTLDYQYYLLKGATAYREIYYNFAYTGGTASEAERRQVRVAGSAFDINDTAASVIKARRQPNFQNQSHPIQALTVLYTVDVRPAIYQLKRGSVLIDRQGPINITEPDSVMTMGVCINGPATDTSYTWQTWGSVLRNDTTRIMYDDGTHGDAVAHDSIYSRVYTYSTNAIIGQEYKFGIGGGDNEGGFGNNHIQNLDDTQPSSTLASQFGSIDPMFYYAWNYDCPCPSALISNLQILNGWNMLALPRRVSDPGKTTLFPTAGPNMFAFNGTQYVTEDTLEKGHGYWLKFDHAQTVGVFGDPIQADSIQATEGWNMIGSISMPQVPPIATIPPGVGMGNFFGYSSGYYIADTLLEGNAYWIKVDQNCKLVLNALSGFGKRSVPSNDLAAFDRVTIRDAAGHAQTLYLGVKTEGMSLMRYEMPPLPPSGGFDVRFASSRMAEVVGSGQTAQFPIAISSAAYPLTVSWECKSMGSSALLMVGTRAVRMTSTGTERIYDSQARLSVKFSGMSSLPKEFALSQNYPNPFNPTTKFSVDIPRNGVVDIAVYDLLGQKITSIMSGQQSAGTYDIVWDGRDVHGFSAPSGIYFVRMTADKFNATRKIMLMK